MNRFALFSFGGDNVLLARVSLMFTLYIHIRTRVLVYTRRKLILVIGEIIPVGYVDDDKKGLNRITRVEVCIISF